MLKKGLVTLFAVMMTLAMAATTEIMVTAEVVHQPNGYALKIGEELAPLKAYEMPICLVKAKKPVKLALKLEGNPPKVVAATVLEGPCPPGTELPTPLKEQVSMTLQKGYLNAQGEVVRKQNRWMLRIGNTEVPIDPTEVPRCLLEDGAKVKVGTIMGDEGELTLIKDGCVAQIKLKDQLKEQIRETLRAQIREQGGKSAAKRERLAMPTQDEMSQHAKKMKESVKDEVENTIPIPKSPGNHAH